MATDLVQVVREGIFSILNTHASVVAVTGRATKNLVTFNTLAVRTERTPILAYLVVSAVEVAGNGDMRDVRTQFTADAEKESDINELLGVVERTLKQPAFAALTPPLNAKPIRRFRREFSLDVTLRVTRSYS